MREFLGALLAILSSRRLGIVGPYESMAWSAAAADNSASSFLRPNFFLRQIYWAIIQNKQLVASLTVFQFHPTDDLLIGISTQIGSPKMVVVGHHVSLPHEQRAANAS